MYRPFFLVALLFAGVESKGVCDSTLSTSRLKFPHSIGTEVVMTQKVWSCQSKSIHFLSKSRLVRTSQELVQLELQEERALRRMNGGLSKRLKSRLSELDDSTEVEIIIGLAFPEVPHLDKTLHSEEELRLHSLAYFQRPPKASREAILAKYRLKESKIAEPGVIRCLARKMEIHAMGKDPEIAFILPYPKHFPLSQHPFSSLSQSAYNPAVGMPLDARGQGINALTMEVGLTKYSTNPLGDPVPYSTFVECLGNLNLGNIDAKTTSAFYDWKHSNATFKCLWNTASGANWFHRDKYHMIGEGPYFAEKVIRSSSMSLAKAEDYTSCTNGAFPTVDPYTVDEYGEFTAMDEMAFLSPFPVFSNPTANWGFQYEANWQAYNAISVGNVQHFDLHSYRMPSNDYNAPLCQPAGGCSQTRNPKARYGGPDLLSPSSPYDYYSSDREMPYVVAPGVSPNSPETMVDNCLDSQTLTCGTSFSAPILNGIATSVLSSDPRMLNWPEKVRAVILATAENVVQGDWNSAYDGRDGAGVVSGANAVAFARNHATVQPGGSAVEYGIGVLTVYQTNFFSFDGAFNIRIPSAKPVGKHLRIVLTWDSNADRTAGYNHLSDLDLVFHGPTSRISASYNGNVEIIDVPSSELTAGASYVAAINKYVNRIPDGRFTYLCIAWTWVNDHAG